MNYNKEAKSLTFGRGSEVSQVSGFRHLIGMRGFRFQDLYRALEYLALDGLWGQRWNYAEDVYFCGYHLKPYAELRSDLLS